MMHNPSWRGVYSAITTKLDHREEVDLEAVKRDVVWQIEGGVHGIVCCGSLGEASTLTAEEKLAIARAAREAAQGRVPVILTIAEDSTRAAVALSEHAADIGVDGLMVLPAMRYVATSAEVVSHFRTVAGASQLPIMIYNNPLAYSIDITPAMLMDLANEPKFVAVKESSGDVRRVTDILNVLGERYAIFAGVDDLALESLVLGAVGWVGGLVCPFPAETVAIYQLVLDGQIKSAREIYRWFMPLLHLDVSHRFVQNIKLVEHLVRGTSLTVRAPRLNLAPDERARIETIVQTALATRPMATTRAA